MTIKNAYLFSWKDIVTYEDYTSIPKLFREQFTCPFCSTSLNPGWETLGFGGKCEKCGYWYFNTNYVSYDIMPMDVMGGLYQPDYWEFAILKKMEINNSEVGLDELGSYLKRNTNHIQLINSRRFEELIEDIYKNLGFQTRLTQATHDGGCDIILFEKGTNEQILVEVKRHPLERKIGVRIVRELLGVQVLTGIKKGKIVASTKYSKFAEDAANIVNTGITGYNLELVDIDKLAKELEVYNKELLNEDTYKKLKEICVFSEAPHFGDSENLTNTK